ncbi:MAG: hypothetical protein ACK5N8_02535 [Alphaproteobacteria bacterium]
MKIGNFLNFKDGKYYISENRENEHTIAIIFDAEKNLACSIEIETSTDWHSAMENNNPEKRLLSVDEFNQILETKSLDESLYVVSSQSFWLRHKIGGRGLCTSWNNQDESIIECAPFREIENVLYVYSLKELGL